MGITLSISNREQKAYGYLDWQSLRLGFQQSGDGAYYLSAIIHDEWTP